VAWTRKAGAMEEILSAIIKWGDSEEEIRAMVLTGSRAGQGPIDELSDYDIALFARDSRTYLVDGRWMSSIGDVWICVHDEGKYGNEVYPTRLVIFRDGIKVDFSFLPVGALEEIAAQGRLPESYDLGYQVLIDKTGLCDRLSPPSFRAYRGGRPRNKISRIA
jgi:aminoglycoside 6-adenylyltransferase